ncbi:aspartate/glutamate racemase family protein [Corticibacter populi]|uniref:Aspartate/glutamate racemase family protein n=1 Tax=Corticibacter populi TaxID=1550736 RepID=A0A3M6QQ12_9BURK|nr:amino acid racemase [Corticibacter populi]RMX04891.1 aspartate/glutamate racemase family protein [Corticibacter populi]
MPPTFRLGVLGGMGPLATVDFLHKLVLSTPAQRDQDHVPTVVWNVPQIADRQQAIAGAGPSPLPQLLDAVAGLNQAGATLIVMPCNTVHHWIEPLRRASPAPLLHIVDATLEVLEQRHAGEDGAGRAERCVGLVATKGALRARLYQDRLQQHGWRVLENTSEELEQLFTPGCYAIKRNALDEGSALLEKAAAALAARGARHLILACTEVPLALAHRQSPLLGLSVDPNQALAWSVLRHWEAVQGAQGTT